MRPQHKNTWSTFVKFLPLLYSFCLCVLQCCTVQKIVEQGSIARRMRNLLQFALKGRQRLKQRISVTNVWVNAKSEYMRLHTIVSFPVHRPSRLQALVSTRLFSRSRVHTTTLSHAEHTQARTHTPTTTPIVLEGISLHLEWPRVACTSFRFVSFLSLFWSITQPNHQVSIMSVTLRVVGLLCVVALCAGMQHFAINRC